MDTTYRDASLSRGHATSYSVAMKGQSTDESGTKSS